MKQALFLLLSLFYLQGSYSQQQFVGMSGLQDNKGDIFFEYRGYSIYVSNKKGNIEKEKTITSIIMKNKQETVLAQYSEPTFTQQNLVIESQYVGEDKPKASVNQACYLFQLSDNDIKMILFQTMNQRDPLLEKDIVSAYLEGKLDELVQVGNNASAIDFVGRNISLGEVCEWKNPHSVACRGGQISWAEFPSYQEAIVDLQARIIANEHPDIHILLDEDIIVLFEGIETTARRIVYMPPGERYSLGVYYIVQEVRGRFVSCVLSNNTYNRGDYELSPLLQQVMTIEVLPENAMNEFDEIELEEPSKFKRYWNKDGIYAGSFRAGTWLPMGNISNLYSVAPSVGVTVGLPFGNAMAVDLSITFAFPVHRKEFDYYIDNNNILDAKANGLVNFGARFRYQYTMARNVYFSPYIGMGYHYLGTNKVERYAEHDDEQNEYYGINTLHLTGGAEIRCKRIGAFAEYHYTPYHISDHARKSLGNSAVSLGLFFTFW